MVARRRAQRRQAPHQVAAIGEESPLAVLGAAGCVQLAHLPCRNHLILPAAQHQRGNPFERPDDALVVPLVTHENVARLQPHVAQAA